METQKNQNSKLFIFGIISLVVSIASLLYSLYILPFLIWGLSYNVSDLVLNIIAYFEDDFYYSSRLSRLITWLIFFVPGVLAGIISYFVSNSIDKKALGLDLDENEPVKEEYRSEQIKKQVQESAGIGLKILFLMGCALGGFVILQMII